MTRPRPEWRLLDEAAYQRVMKTAERIQWNEQRKGRYSRYRPSETDWLIAVLLLAVMIGLLLVGSS